MGASLAARVRHTGKAANNRSAGATPSTLVASPKCRPHGGGVPRADRCSHRDEVVEEGARQAVGCVAAEAGDGVPGQVDRAVLDVHLQGEGRWERSSWGYTTAGSGHALPGLAGQAAWARTSECSSACRDASDPPLPRLGTSFAGTSRTWRQQVEGGRWSRGKEGTSTRPSTGLCMTAPDASCQSMHQFGRKPAHRASPSCCVSGPPCLPIPTLVSSRAGRSGGCSNVPPGAGMCMRPPCQARTISSVSAALQWGSGSRSTARAAAKMSRPSNAATTACGLSGAAMALHRQ